METEWFESWFESPLYDLLYKHRDEAEAEVFIQNLLQKLTLKAGSKVMDLCCGKGRHARYMSQFGHEVTGLDLSQRKITYARDRSPSGNPSFEVHDMREQYGMGEEFDLVTNLFTSFGYFEDFLDNLKVLQAVHFALKTQGTFVLDFLNASKVIANLETEKQLEIDGWEVNINKSIEDNFVVKKMLWSKGEERHHFQERVRLIHQDAFFALFEQAELCVEAIYGDYMLNDFDENSPRFICVVKKQ